MNVNYNVKCRICDSITRIRIPIGHVNKFPIRIHCGKCKNIILGEVNINQKEISYDVEFFNVDEVRNVEINYFAEASGELPCNKVENCIVENLMYYAERMPGMNAVLNIGHDNMKKFFENFYDLSNELENWNNTKIIFNLLKNREYRIDT